MPEKTYISSGETGGNLVADKTDLQAAVKEVRDRVNAPGSLDTVFDDSGVITIDKTVTYSTPRIVTGSTHTLTFATTGNVNDNYKKVLYQFDVDCELTLENLKDDESTIGTVNSIPAGTYPFWMFTASNGHVALLIQNNTGTTPGTLSTPTLVLSVGNGQAGYVITNIDSNATAGVLEYSTDNVNWTTWGSYSFGVETGTITGLTNGVLYYGRYRNSASGYLPSSYATDTVTPSAGVTQLTAVTIGTPVAGNTKVTLPFTNPNSGNEDGNRVYYKLSSEPTIWTLGVLAASGATTVDQTGLTNGSEYDFKIVAIGTGSYSNSVDSNIVTETPLLIVMQDDFAGTTIDTGKWTKTDPVDGVTITQNDQLIFTIDRTSPVASTNTNRMDTFDSITEGCFQFDIVAGTAEYGDGTLAIALSESHGTDATAQILTLAGGSATDTGVRLRVFDGGVSSDVDITSGTDEFFSTWRIRYQLSNTTIYWEELTAPDTWTVRRSYVLNLGSTLTGRIGCNSVSGTGTKTYLIDNVYLTNDTYSTSTPS